MANQWFRMYHEFATDPKIQMLSEADQRRYVMLLCLRCSNEHVTLHDTEVAFQLRISNEQWSETKKILQSKNLINEDNQPANWDKRQFESDSSSARVKAYRERKKAEEEAKKKAEGKACNDDETLQKRNVNALHTDTDKTHTPSADGSEPDPKPKPKTTEHHKALAKELSSAVAERFPSQKIKLTAWADDIRKLIEIDKRTDSEIRELWAWIQQHGDARFSWAQNIRTPGKLRERDNQGLKYFDKLADQMRQDSKQRDSGKPSSLHSFDNVDYSYGVTADGRF